MQHRKLSTQILVFVASVSLAACGGRTAEAIFEPPPDASADASGSTSSGAGGSTTTSIGAGGASITTGAGGTAGQAGGSGGSGPSAVCNSGNCSGCCDAQHRCQKGHDLNACGSNGATCLDCGALGFGCTANGTCEGPKPPCSSANCSGCCADTGLCRFGTESDACGVGGGKCADCSAKGAGCSAGVCQGPPPKCGPATCGGCCDAQGQCQIGSTDAVCGTLGAACQSCAAKSQSCTQPGSYCAAPIPCAIVCPAGCCDARGVCRAPSDTACGTKGQSCSDCTLKGLVCAPQAYCYAGKSCGPDNCAGCCTATGDCLGGADTASCGQFGSLCDNCSAKNETCVNQVCSNGSICPSAFAGCSPGAITDPPKVSTSCSDKDLATMRIACAGAGTGCEAAFGRLYLSNPACAGCLAQFVGDQAFTRCLAPFLTNECNHSLTCGVDCSNTVCGQCPAADKTKCQNAAGNPGGACGAYAYGYVCAVAALQGPGAFCNWDMYMDAGKWIEAVGGRYCR